MSTFASAREGKKTETKRNQLSFVLTSSDAPARRRLLRHRPRQELELVVEQRGDDLGRLRRRGQLLADQRVGRDVGDVGVLVLEERRVVLARCRGRGGPPGSSSPDGVPHAPGVALGLPVGHAGRGGGGGSRRLARRGGLGAGRLATGAQGLEVRAELVARPAAAPAAAAAAAAARGRDALVLLGRRRGRGPFRPFLVVIVVVLVVVFLLLCLLSGSVCAERLVLRVGTGRDDVKLLLLLPLLLLLVASRALFAAREDDRLFPEGGGARSALREPAAQRGGGGGGSGRRRSGRGGESGNGSGSSAKGRRHSEARRGSPCRRRRHRRRRRRRCGSGSGSGSAAPSSCRRRLQLFVSRQGRGIDLHLAD